MSGSSAFIASIVLAPTVKTKLVSSHGIYFIDWIALYPKVFYFFQNYLSLPTVTTSVSKSSNSSFTLSQSPFCAILIALFIGMGWYLVLQQLLSQFLLTLVANPQLLVIL